MVTTDEITAAVCAEYRLQPHELKINTNRRAISEPRFVAMELMHRMGHQTHNVIGLYFGRDHSHVYQAKRFVADNRRYNPEFDTRYNAILNHLRELLFTVETPAGRWARVYERDGKIQVMLDTGEISDAISKENAYNEIITKFGTL